MFWKDSLEIVDKKGDWACKNIRFSHLRELPKPAWRLMTSLAPFNERNVVRKS